MRRKMEQKTMKGFTWEMDRGRRKGECGVWECVSHIWWGDSDIEVPETDESGQ